MKVFKSYFKILNKKKGSMLMYIGIFAGIIFGFILPNSGKTEDEYKSMKCKFAWFDYDHTEESEELFSYLDHAHKHAELKTDTTEAMQDSLFNRNTDCIVRIKKGYADHLDKEDLSDYIEIVAIPNRSKVELFESDGTIRTFGLAAQVQKILEKDAFLAVDEIESSLHPKLIEYIIERFLKESENAQLLLTKHYDALL